MRLPARVQAVVDDVSARRGVSLAGLMGHSRVRPLVLARHEAFACVRALTMPNGRPPSYPRIGQWFGCDHTTALAGVRRHLKRAGEIGVESKLDGRKRSAGEEALPGGS